MRRVLWWLLGGSRGGKNRLRVIRTLAETPMNAHQLSKTLDLDYKTIRHHLELLCENDVLTTMGDDYGKTYFLTERMEANVDVLDEVARKAGLDEPTTDEDDPAIDSADVPTRAGRSAEAGQTDGESGDE
jgi:DNA-binding transcriptional ArsR family regulator